VQCYIQTSISACDSFLEAVTQVSRSAALAQTIQNLFGTQRGNGANIFKHPANLILNEENNH